MLISEEVLLGVFSKLKYYQNLGYPFIKKGSYNIRIEDLSINSHLKVDVKCDDCDLIKKMSYQKHHIFLN